MKNLRTFLLSGLIAPILAQAQYTGGIGRGDAANTGTLSGIQTIATSLWYNDPQLCPPAQRVLRYDMIGNYAANNVLTFQLSNANGNFAQPTVLGTVSASGGTQNGFITLTIPAGLPAGTAYRIRAVSSSPSVTGLPLDQPMTIGGPRDAGTNGTLTVCSNQNGSLMQALGGAPVPGGTWSGPSPTNGNYQASNMEPGVYTYTLPFQAPCVGSTSATVTVTEVSLANAGTDATLPICSTDEPVDLNALLGVHDSGGTWNGPSSIPGGIYDPATMNGGNYEYTVLAQAPCAQNDVAHVNVQRSQPVNAGNDGAITLCSNGNSVNLMSVLGPGAGPGSWIGPSTLSGNSYNPVTMVPGTYIRISDQSGACERDSAFVEVSEVLAPNAGSNGTLSICSGADPAALFSYLNGTPQSGGSWSGPSPVVNGMYAPATMSPGTYHYTVAGQAPCNSAGANVIVTETSPPMWYADVDGDGFGDPVATQSACAQPVGFVANSTDNCPAQPGLVGSPCNDQNPLTDNDVLTVDCGCAGTLAPCTADLTIAFTVGSNGTVPAWELRMAGTSIVVQSGTAMAMPPGTVLPVNTCTPDGHYYLRVTGAMGTGGGYVLRTSGDPGTRVVDNTANYVGGASSQVATNDGVQIPVGASSLIYTSCDKTYWKTGEYIVCNEDVDVSAQYGVTGATSGYEYWIYDPNGGYSFRKLRSHSDPDGFAPANGLRACHMKINNWGAANHVPQNQLMNVRVRARVAGVNKPWGPACRFIRNDALAACPPTKLMDIPGNAFISCGVTKAFNALTANRVHARPVSGATQYQFRFSLPGEGGTIVTRGNTTYYINLGWTAAQSPILLNGVTYDVDVRAMVGGVWCAWGDICKLTICNAPPCGGGAQGGNQNNLLETSGALRLWPNPNRGDHVYMRLDGLPATTKTVSVELYDMAGARLLARSLPVKEGAVSLPDQQAGAVIELNGFAAGVYLVQITAGDRVYTERLVIHP